MGTGTGMCDPLSLKLLGARLPHGEALEIRLDFIGFVVSKSNLELTFALVETLWRDFLQKPLCGAYVDGLGARRIFFDNLLLSKVPLESIP